MIRLQLTDERHSKDPIAQAWADQENLIVYVRPPFHRRLFPRARVAHEVEHLLEADFDGNEDHHPWHHFCGRVAHGVRLSTRHLSPRSVRLAGELLRTGLAAP